MLTLRRRERVARLALVAMLGTLVLSLDESQTPPRDTPEPFPQRGVGKGQSAEGSGERRARSIHPKPLPRTQRVVRKGSDKPRRSGATRNRQVATASPAANDANSVPRAKSAPSSVGEALQSPKEQRALLQLFVNTEDKGEVIVILRDDDVLVPAVALARSGIGGPLSEDSSGYVSLSELRPGIEYTVDEEDLALHLAVAPELFATRVIDLRRRAPENIEYSNDASVYLNYAPRVTNNRAIDIFLELGAAAGPASFYSGVWGLWDHGFRRGLTNFTYDDRSSLNRIVVGDSFVTTGPLGGGAYLGGLTLMRSFELDPYLIRTPSFDFVDTASTPSTLEVYVNDTLVRRESVAPGTFKLEHLNAPAGAGATRYVIRDAFGYEKQISSEYYLSQGLLAQGLSDYTFSVGIRRDRVGLESFDYREPGFLLRHRVGVTKQLTLGFRGEAAESLLSGGSGLTFGTLLGQFDFALSASSANQESGYAGLLAHTYYSRKAGISTTLRIASDRYATISTSPTDDRDILQGAVSGSLALMRNLTASLQHSVAKSRDYGLSQRTSLRSSLRLTRELSLSVTANHWITEQSPRRLEAFVGLSWAAGNAVHASATAHVATDGSEALVDVHKPLPTGEGYGFRASAAAGNVERAHVLVQTQDSHGRYQASYDNVGGEHHTVLEASGSIVAVGGGGVFFSRPIGKSFAVLDVPEAANVRGYLENREVGRTNSSGKLLIPDLLPYYGNRVSIADSDLPADVGIDRTERIIAPPFRGGAVVRYEARTHRYFRGKVVMTRNDERIVPAYGEIALENGKSSDRFPLGRQGELELEGLSQGKYAFVVEHQGSLCRGSLEIPQTDTLISDLGQVRCVLDAKVDQGDNP